MKNLFLSAVVTIALGFVSCSNDDESVVNSNSELNVAVSKMGDYLSQMSRAEVLGDSVVENLPILSFKDQQDYDNTVRKLQAMTPAEREEYFKKYNYESACMFIDRVDAELDAVFEVEDSLVFIKCLDLFQQKYKNVVAYDEKDSEDYTPYLTFSDGEMSSVSNALGYVVIDNKLVGPEDSTPDYGEKMEDFTDFGFEYDEPGDDGNSNEAVSRAWMPIVPGFKAFRNAEIAIKKGKYRSTMNIGRIFNGNSFALKFNTKKKVFWVFKKSVKTNYSCTLTLSSNIFNHTGNVVCPKGKEVVILGLPIERVGMTFNADVKNFKSGKCTNPGSRTFTNLKVI